MKKKAPGAGTASRQSAGQSEQSPLVLIVDDVADNRTVYAMYLTFSGYRVAEAANGKDAIDSAERLLPDVIVMDLSLPLMDGWEATRRLKKSERTKGIPVIALTGHALAHHANRAREAGCEVVITKPCLPEDLVTKLRGVLGPGLEPQRGR